jgi:hypothetical protein
LYFTTYSIFYNKKYDSRIVFFVFKIIFYIPVVVVPVDVPTFIGAYIFGIVDDPLDGVVEPLIGIYG